MLFQKRSDGKSKEIREEQSKALCFIRHVLSVESEIVLEMINILSFFPSYQHTQNIKNIKMRKFIISGIEVERWTQNI
jgi:hypothetical protein